MTPDTAPAINRLTLVGVKHDPFTGMPEMSQVFYGLADFISVWVHRYGFRVSDIDAGEVGWKTPNMLTFRVWRKGLWRRPLSPAQYDVRLPENPWALRYRIPRVQGFLWRAEWFKRVMARVDGYVREWAADNGAPLPLLKVAARWPSSGHVVLKLIHPFKGTTGPRQFMTHYKHE